MAGGFGSEATISSIVIWNRTDCCGSRLNDYWVFISDTPFLPTDTPSTLQNRLGTFGSHQTAAPNPTTTITTGGGAVGRFVRVQLTNPNYLSLAEVQVFGHYSPPNGPPANTALGIGALGHNISGADNVAIGERALESNVNGAGNTAIGFEALDQTNGGGSQENVAVGFWAGYGITTGSNNTAIGAGAMFTGIPTSQGGSGAPPITGNNNIAIGPSAGANLRAGSNNIDIAALGDPADSGVIRIGLFYGPNPPIINAAYVQGIFGVNPGAGANVVVSSTGQLGVNLSSRRYKEDIHDMGKTSENLLRLRPVTFHYRKPYADGSKPLDYGLIAEEVAEVYPDLVVKGVDGQVETVQYQKLTPMLLNEVQKQNRQILQQAETIHLQQEEYRKLEARLAALEALMSTKTPTTASVGQ